MRHSRKPGPTDPELLTRVGFVPTAEATEGSEVAVNLQERSAHLIEALNHFDSMTLIEGDIAMYHDKDWREIQEERFGKYGAYQIQVGKYDKLGELANAARHEFDSAYGLQPLKDQIEAEELSETEEASKRAELQREVDERFSAFTTAYRGSSDMRMDKRHQQRQHYRKILFGEKVVAPLVQASPESTREDKISNLKPTDRISLSTALNPQFLGVFLDRVEYLYLGVTDTDLQRVNPKWLRPALVDVRPNKRNVLRQPLDDGSYVYTVFTPYEHPHVLRTKPVFPADVAYNHTETSQHKRPIDEHDPDASRRAQIHINERMDEWMQGYINNRIDPSLQLIDRIREASRFNGGLARFGNVLNMQTQMRYFWEEIVGDMLWAVRVAERNDEGRNWEEETRTALEYVVYFTGTPTQQIERLNVVADLAYEWLEAKKAYMIGRSQEIQKYIYAQETPDERRARAESIQQSA